MSIPEEEGQESYSSNNSEAVAPETTQSKKTASATAAPPALEVVKEKFELQIYFDGIWKSVEEHNGTAMQFNTPEEAQLFATMNTDKNKAVRILRNVLEVIALREPVFTEHAFYG